MYKTHKKANSFEKRKAPLSSKHQSIRFTRQTCVTVETTLHWANLRWKKWNECVSRSNMENVKLISSMNSVSDSGSWKDRNSHLFNIWLEAWHNTFLCGLRWVTQIWICLNASWVHLQVIIHEDNYKSGWYHTQVSNTFKGSWIKAVKNRSIVCRCKNTIL